MLKRIDSSNLAASAYIVLGVFAAGMFFMPAEIKLTVVGVCAVVYIFMNLAFQIPLLHGSVRLQWEEGNRVIESIKMKFLPLEVVEQRLQQLADELTALCQEQVRFQNAASAVDEAKAIGEKIARAKSAFWEAHALAKELGYVLKAHVGDYVSVPKAPARRRGKQAV